MYSNPQKFVQFARSGDTLEVIVRDDSFTKIFSREVSVSDRKGLKRLLKDLRAKGVDLVNIIKKEFTDSSDWFG